MSKGFSELRGGGRKASGHRKHGKINNAEHKEIQKASVLMQQGNYKDAEVIYRELVKQGTKNYVVLGNLAAICGIDNRIEEVVLFSKEALKLNPNYPEGLSTLGLALQKQGDLQAAVRLYEKALARKPNLPNTCRNLANACRNLGNALQQQGDLQAAIQLYKKALAMEPNSLEALVNLGSALGRERERQEAIACGKKALAIDPNSLGALVNLGNDLRKEGEVKEAIACSRKALAIDPNSLGALVNLGAALKEDGEFQEAIACSRKALAMAPNCLEALINLGDALREEGECQEAVDCCRKALAMAPNCLEALVTLGGTLAEKEEFQEAVACCRKALAIDPNCLEALVNLGGALGEEDKFQEAIDCCKKALAIKPNYPNALVNLSAALSGKEEFQEAIDCCKKALAIKPNYPNALAGLAIVLDRQGEVQEAITMYRKAISLRENYSTAHWNLSLTLLSSGDYGNGWREYEWRLRRHNAKLHVRPRLRKWDDCNGSSKERLILVSEQGLGDVLQFMRYVPCLSKQGMVVSLCAPTKLHGLIQTSGIATEIYSPAEVDQLTTGEWLPLLSLPKYLNVSPVNPVVDTPYIKVPEQRVEHWQQKLSSEKRPIIGINWQGNPRTERSTLRGRSLPLEAFAPITETMDASFLSLQKGFGSEQLTECTFLDRFVACQEEINQTWDFVETAAMMMNCDLIITSDSAVAHLAGGLGRPTWLLLHKTPDWRWGREGDTSFWYPSMRLFRQRERGNWPEVMDRVAKALAVFSANRAGSPVMAKTPPSRNVSSVMIPVALAELIDKITILEIKSEKFKGERKQNVDHELNLLQHILEQSGVDLLSEHRQKLKAVNESLWQIEEDIRSHEADQDFGETFVQLARSVYLQNDQRAAIKRRINDHYGSEIVEEKSYR